LPSLYAHRGAAAELPENTLPAFELALSVGATAIETDCHMTSDGHVVLSHDPTGERMAGVARAIKDCTLDEVRTWDVGRGFVDARGERPFAGKGFRIPTLAEALRAHPDVRFNVDAKQDQPDMTAALLEAILRADACDRTLLASFDAGTLGRIRRAGYPGPTGLARREVLLFLGCPVRLLDVAGVIRGQAAQLPHRAFGLDLGKRAVVERAHRLGLEVHYWTVNDLARARELLALGADGIMTDDPRRIAPAFT
jgi:glycerophosphoryl diester phosphodiesterase